MTGDELDAYCADLAARVSAGALSFDAAAERAQWARFSYDALIDALEAEVAHSRPSLVDAVRCARDGRERMVVAFCALERRLSPPPGDG